MVEGAHKSLRGAAKERIADFVHGSDGFGNTRPQLAEVTTELPINCWWCISAAMDCRSCGSTHPQVSERNAECTNACRDQSWLCLSQSRDFTPCSLCPPHDHCPMIHRATPPPARQQSLSCAWLASTLGRWLCWRWRR